MPSENKRMLLQILNETPGECWLQGWLGTAGYSRDSRDNPGKESEHPSQARLQKLRKNMKKISKTLIIATSTLSFPYSAQPLSPHFPLIHN